MISEKKGFEVVLKVDSEDDPVRSKVRKYKNLPREKFSNWIEAGEGNYSFTKDSGKYRPSCNTLQGIRPLKKCDSCGDVKKIISHCDKFDCSTCFSWTAHERTQRIVSKHMFLEEETNKRKIRMGKPSHIVFSPKKKLVLFLLIERNGYNKLVNRFKMMLEEIGIHSGTLIFHLRSIKCKKCKKPLDDCICNDKDKELYKAINVHFHCFGYGFIDHISKFKEKYPNWNYMKIGRLQTKEDLTKAVFYALSKSSIWRKREDGKLMKSYDYFGFLKKGLRKIKEQVKLIPDKCKCSGLYHYIEKGYKLEGDIPKFDENLSLIEVANSLGIRIMGLKEDEIKERISQKVISNKNLKIFIDDEKLVLGNPVYLRRKVRTYKLLRIRELKRTVKECRNRYLKQRREIRRKKLDAGSEYG